MIQLVIALLGIFSALLLAKVQSLLSENAKLREELNSKKHQIYEDLVDFLSQLVDNEFKGDVAKKTKELTRKLTFFGSAKVLKAFGDMMQHFYKESSKLEPNNP